MNKTRCRILLVVLGTAFAGVACEPEPVAHYRAPKDQPPPAPRAEGPRRMLGVILPRAERTWFFKAVGHADAMAQFKPLFLRIVSSTKFEGAEAQWSLPEGWHREPAEGLRYATLHTGHGSDDLEITVSRFAGDAGGLAANVNRWRRQLNLEPIAEADLPKHIEDLRVAGDEAYAFDFVGTGSGQMTPPPAGGDAPPPADFKPDPDKLRAVLRVLMRFEQPEGWTPVPQPPDSMHLFAFDVGEADARAQTTVTSLPGAAGGLRANVNRWRRQIGLPEIDAAQINQEARSREVMGLPAVAVDLEGEAERILGALVIREGMSLFFKLKGPKATVEDQARAFEQFLDSMRLEDPGAAQ